MLILTFKTIIKMKKNLLLLGLSALLFTACQQQEKKRYFSESAEMDVLKAGIEAYESGDWDKWKSHFADTAKVYVNSKESVSVETRLEQLSGGAAGLSSYGFDKEDDWMEMVIDADEETWVYYWAQWNGEFTGTKRKVSVPIHLALQFDGGKIVEEHVYFDSTAMNKEMAALASMTDLDKKIHSQIDVLIDDFNNKQDFSVLGDLIADNHERYVNDVKVAAGQTELQSSMAPYFTGFPDFNIEILHKSTIVDNAIFVHWKLTGTNDGEFAESPATGKKIDVNGLTRLHFNEVGKIHTEHIHFDRLQLMEQLGKSLN